MLWPIKIASLTVLGLLGIGLYGLLVTRNLIKLIVVLQLLVKTALLALALAGKVNGHINLGQTLAVTVIVADTIIAVIGLALAVQVQRHCGALDVKTLSTLRG